MASYSPQSAAVTGITPTYNAAAATDVLQQNDGRTVILVKNDGASPTNVTIDDTGSQTPVGASAFTPDVVVAVPAGEERLIGPFSVNRFKENVGLAFSEITSITWAAVKLPIV